MRINIKYTWLIVILTLLLSGCFSDLKEKANQQFGDQHFKTAIALIELHKVREGAYPASLDSLKYLGDWDRIIFGSVNYKKLEDGYELDLVNGWMGKPEELHLSKGFWKGIGLKKSNMKTE